MTLSLLIESLKKAQLMSNISCWMYNVKENKIMFNQGINKFCDRISHAYSDLQEMIEFLNPEDRQKVYDGLEKLLSGETAVNEIRVIQSDGSLKKFITKAEPVLGEDGKVTKILGTIQDITEIKTLQEKIVKNQKLMVRAEELTHTGSWEMDLENEIIIFSELAHKIYGLFPEATSLTYKEFIEMVHPEDRKIIADIFKTPVSREAIEVEFRIIRPVDGALRYISEVAEFIFDENDQPIKLFGIICDLTEKIHLEKKVIAHKNLLNMTKKKYTTLIKDSADLFEIVHPDGTLKYISEASEKVLGFKPEERIGRKVYEFYDDSEAEKLSNMIGAAIIEPKRKIKGNLIFNGKEGEKLHIEVEVQNYLNETAIRGLVVHVRNITENLALEEKTRLLINYDQLTGLANHLYLKNKLEECCSREKRLTDIVLYMLDIDSYKHLRDTLGCHTADKLIIETANRLKKLSGKGIFVSRCLDDRFVIINENLKSKDEYRIFAEEILKALAEPLQIDQLEMNLDFSLGISACYYNNYSGEDLIKAAEKALYFAKIEGKNKYKFFSRDINVQNYKMMILSKELGKSIEKDQLRLSFQPIVNLKTNEIQAVEVLVKWQHPELGLVSPDELVYLAENTGYITEIGHWMFEEVCSTYKNWLNQGLPKIKVLVRFTSIQFLEKNFVDSILNIINRYGLEPGFLILEITESVLMDKSNETVKELNRLRSQGIKIAMDDFGTGFSSLAYLVTINVDVIKVDDVFIQNLEENKACAVITKHIADIARDLNIDFIAKNIDSWEQLSFLRNIDCFLGQGYIFSKAVNKRIFEEILARKVLKPKLGIDPKALSYKEKRKFFRINFRQPLEADLTVLEVNGRKVSVGTAKVLIRDIGPGGLCFISDIKLPVEKSLILQLTTELLGKEIKVFGYSVWAEEIYNNVFKYGINYTIDDNMLDDLVKILYQVEIKMKRDVFFADGRFVSGSPDIYFKRN